jgi:hypothetical protein
MQELLRKLIVSRWIPKLLELGFVHVIEKISRRMMLPAESG